MTVMERVHEYHQPFYIDFIVKVEVARNIRQGDRTLENLRFTDGIMPFPTKWSN